MSQNCKQCHHLPSGRFNANGCQCFCICHDQADRQAVELRDAFDLIERLVSAGYRLMQLAGGAEIETGDVLFACKEGVFSEQIAAQRIKVLMVKHKGESK